MASFRKIVFGSCLGYFLALFILMLLALVAVGIANINQSKIEKGAILVVDFDGILPELTDNTSESVGFSSEQSSYLGVYEAIEVLNRAAEDESISQVLLKTEDTRMGFVTMTTLADALGEFREKTDKVIYSYGDYFSQSGFLLASLADSFYLNPVGAIDFKGFGVIQPFTKDFLDNLGIKMNVFYNGTFKSATEIWTRNDMSENSKQQTREFLDQLHEQYLSRLSINRNIDILNLNDAIHNHSFSDADIALQYGAVDGLLNWYELEDKMRRHTNIPSEDDLNYITLGEYNDATKKEVEKKKENRIAVIFAEGEIHYKNKEYGVVNEEHFHETFNEIRKDENIKAIVLRVNSPGGSAFTSEFILEEIKKLQQDGMPVIASYGDYAASGGYYISCSADTIVADANTLTGSIGAYSILPEFNRLLEDKIGLKHDTVKTGPFAAGFSSVMGLNENDKAHLQRMNDKVYYQFVSRVAEGRGMTIEEVENVAQGRVWTGTKAKELNLVDEIGTLEDAIAIAAAKADLDGYETMEYPIIEKSKFKEIIGQLTQNSVHSWLNSNHITKQIQNTLDRYSYYAKQTSPQTLMPFTLEF